MSEVLGCSDDLREAAREFEALLTIENGYIVSWENSGEWQVVPGDSHIFKVTGINAEKGLFIKFYAPSIRAYAQSVGKLLMALAELDASPQILAPKALCGGSLVFDLGENARQDQYGFVFRSRDKEAIFETVSRYGLEPLRVDESVIIALVDVGGREHAVDPFDDSALCIIEYVERNRGGS